MEHPAGPLLVLAGAGSGKTRVLTERIARLMREGVPAGAVLAFTFTNRAAREMRERIERSVGEPARRLWMGTFHGTGLRILRREVRNLGPAERHKEFVIYDREDQEKTLDQVLKRLNIPSEGSRGPILARISDAKSALVTPEEAARAAVAPFERRAAECSQLYQEMLRQQGAFDFDDLIAEVVWLFRRRPDLAESYAQRFHHVLVDEYQDTSHSQFRFVELLAKGHDNIFVVGDDDQSIYGFRGADLRGAAFTDLGLAWNRNESPRIWRHDADGKRRLDDLMLGFGVGARTAVSFLLLRLDVAWHSDFQDVSQPRWHFSIGPEF